LQLDEHYEVTQDVKGQLRFLEELERLEKKRHDEQEREILIKAAKSRSKSEDPEQAKLKAKAKEVRLELLLNFFKILRFKMHLTSLLCADATSCFGGNETKGSEFNSLTGNWS